MIKKKKFNLDKKIIIGTAQFSNNYGIVKKKNQNPFQFIKSIKKFRPKTFDTSVNYKGSINLIESKIKNSNLVIKLSTRNYSKITPILKFKKQVNLISKKIKKNKIYSLMIHDFSLSFSKEINDHINFLSEYCKKNKIHFGFSIYNLKEFNYIKKYDFKVLQVPINVFNREFISSKFARYVKLKKIEVHARSIFLQGLLVNDLELSPKKFSKFKSIFDSWQRLCKKNKISRINACINFILNLSFVSKLIIGFKNSEEVKELSKIQGHKIDFYNKKIFKKIPQNLKDPNLWKNIK